MPSIEPHPHAWMEIRQLDFLLAHPQDDVEGTIFMWLPKGFELGSGKTQQTQVATETFKSASKGFIAQMKDSLMKAKYKAATVFLDRHSDLAFVHMQNDQSSNDTRAISS